ncbi:hypothetical protein [Clostridium thailandense]|uniref:hypothetical protein n=1 Tax=Clostridium thailandense TaxID=2794346 RepID=UPI0039896AAB
MSKDKVYKIIIILSLSLCVFLIVKSYNITQKIINNRVKLSSIEKVNNKNDRMKKLNFYNVIEELGSKQKVKINNLVSKDSDKEISTQINVYGDISTVRDILEDIKKKNNYQSVDNIKISRDKNRDISADINMEFIKNN